MTPLVSSIMAHVVPLEQALDPALAGGKASRLARARAAGHVVPSGVVVTTAALREHTARANAGRDDGPGFAEAVRAWPVDEDLLEAVIAALDAPLAAGWIVRSSGVGEDGAGASFAGQLDSVADVTTRAGLADALRTVWASCASERALAYQRGRGVRLAGVAVIVQRQVTARAAGVMFTRHPEAGKRDRLRIEWVAGPSEALVQGRAEPAVIELAREEEEKIEHEHELGDAPARLRRLGLALERLFEGAPQDVEWVLDPEGALHLVQSRDQTGLATRSSDGGPRRRWTNSNLIENFPDPITPFLGSVLETGYYHLFQGLGRAFGVSRRRLAGIEHSLRHLTGKHGGRVYYDLTSVREVLAAAPFGDLLAGLFERYVGAPRGHGSTPAPATSGLGARAAQGLEVLAIAARVTWLYRDVGARVARFEATVDEYARVTALPVLVAKDQAALLEDLRRFVDLRSRWVDPGLADVAAMVTSGLLAALLERALPERAVDGLVARLLTGLDDLASAAPVDALWTLSRRVRAERAVALLLAREPDDRAALAALAAARDPALVEFRGAFDGWLEAWGFRCSGELALTTPSLQDEPWRALALVRAYAQDDGTSPAERVARQALARRAAEAEVAGALRERSGGRARAALFGRLLAATHASIGLRERARLRQALLYTRLRGVALALGARLAARGLLVRADDVWFLTWQEVDALAAGGALDPHGAREIATLRRTRHARWPGSVPEVVELPAGDVHEHEREHGPLTQSDEHEHEVLTGAPASPGRRTAPARVLEHVADAGRLARGDVLVVRQTDPGWAPALFLAGALVVERGGLLSHGAIVAREYGLPSVVGVRDATRAIAEGRVVTVDGDAGRVTLV